MPDADVRSITDTATTQWPSHHVSVQTSKSKRELARAGHKTGPQLERAATAPSIQHPEKFLAHSDKLRTGRQDLASCPFGTTSDGEQEDAMESLDGRGDLPEFPAPRSTFAFRGMPFTAPFAEFNRVRTPSSIRPLQPDHSDSFRVDGDFGALMIYAAPDLVGSEIRLLADDGEQPRCAGRVRERQLADGVSFAAVFPSLRRGIYTIEGSQQRLSITGGKVTTLEYGDGCCRVYYFPSSTSSFADE